MKNKREELTKLLEFINKEFNFVGSFAIRLFMISKPKDEVERAYDIIKGEVNRW